MNRWPLLRNRDYMLLWGGEILSELGSQTSTVALPLLVLAVTGSAAKAGIVGLAKWLPVTVFSLPAGALADRLNRKQLMIGCDLGRLLAVASIIVAIGLDTVTYVQIAIVAFLDGALMITSYICERGALGQVVPAEQLEDAVAQNEARSFGAGIAGPPLGGALFSVARALPFVADAVSFLCSVTAISLTRSQFEAGASEETLGKQRRRLGDGVRWLRAQPFFRAAVLLFAFGNPVFTGLYLLAILLAKHGGASSASVGVMFALMGLGGVVGAISAGAARRRLRPWLILVGEAWILAAAVLLLLVVRAPLLIGVVLAAAEFGTPITNSVVTGSRVAAVPDHLQGRVAAASALVSSSLGWFGPLAVGSMFQALGPTPTVLAVAGWAVALAGLATAAPGLRTSPYAAPEEVSPGPEAAQAGMEDPV